MIRWLKRIFKMLAVLALLLVLLPVGIAVVAWWRYEPVPAASILRLTLDGELPEQPPSDAGSLLLGRSMLTAQGVIEAIDHAADDARIVGLVLEVQNPAISLATVQELEAAMARFRASGKWNVAYLETVGELDADNAAYAVATTANRVYLSPAGEVNLANVRATVPFFRGMLDKLHIKPYFDKRAEFKTAPNSFTQTKLTDAHKESLATIVGDLQTALVEHVAARRAQSSRVVQKWLQEGAYGAAQAKELGLVDEVRYWDEVAEEARGVAGRDEPWVDGEVYSHAGQSHTGPAVALIYVTGQIMRGNTPEAPWSGSEQITGAATVAQALRDARDAEVKGVLLRIDSPGGSYVASDLIRREVELTRQAGVPVVVSMGSMAASGGYFCALPADKIVAAPSTLTGSIGVFAGNFALRDFFSDWLGVTFDEYAAAPGGSAMSWLDPPNEAMRKRMAAALDRIYDDFVQKTAQARGLEPQAMAALAAGRVWSGAAAAQRGLVDEVGGFTVAVHRLKELAQLPTDAPINLVLFPQPKGTIELLRDLLSQESMQLDRVSLMMRVMQRLSTRLHGQMPLLLPMAVSL